jgi:multidrug efflux pump subunit AcrB
MEYSDIIILIGLIVFNSIVLIWFIYEVIKIDFPNWKAKHRTWTQIFI